MKRCTKCGRELELDRFARHKGKRDDLRSQCKDCDRAYREQNAERIAQYLSNYYVENKGQLSAYHKEWSADNADHLREYRQQQPPETPEQRERRLSHRREWRKQNLEYERQYREKHRERLRKYNREWLRAHPATMLAGLHRRRARVAESGGSYTPAEWRALCERYTYTCLCCGRQEPEIKLTVDHVIPISKGGSNDISNIQPLCSSCNFRKHARIIDYRPFWESGAEGEG